MAVVSHFLGFLSAGWGWIDAGGSNHRRPVIASCGDTGIEGWGRGPNERAFSGFRPRRMRVEDHQVGDRTMDHD